MPVSGAAGAFCAFSVAVAGVSGATSTASSIPRAARRREPFPVLAVAGGTAGAVASSILCASSSSLMPEKPNAMRAA